MPNDDWKKKYENDDFGLYASHGAENIPCINCKYRKIYKSKSGRVVDTGRGGFCDKYPKGKPNKVLWHGDDCPEFEKDKEK